MSAQHTPGPWSIDPEDLQADPDSVFSVGIWAPGSDERVMVAHVSAFGLHSEMRGGTEYISPTEPEPSDLDTAKANARLIAASPDLLEALRIAEHSVGDIHALGVVRSAIAKATGGAA